MIKPSLANNYFFVWNISSLQYTPTMSIEVSKALDYSPKEISAGSYNLRLVNPENGVAALSLNSTTNSEFLLPNDVFNLSRSFLNFSAVIASAGADTWASFHDGFCAAIDGITLSTASGTRMVELTDIPYYTKLAWRAETNFEEYMTKPCHTPAIATAANVIEPAGFFHRVRKLNSDAEQKAGTSGGWFADHSTDGKAVDVDVEPITGVSNHVSASALATAVAVNVQLPLKMFYGSLLAMDKDLYFNEQVRLTIRWNMGKKWGYYRGTNAATTPINSTYAAANDLAAVPTLTNVQLRVAVETNRAVNDNLKAKVMGDGISINMPYVHAFKGFTSGTASATDSYIRKLNNGHGNKLLRIMAGVFGSTQDGVLYCNNYNYSTATPPAPPKFTHYRSYLDSAPIQDDLLSVALGTAWQYNSEKFRGSVIRDQKDWQQACVIIEDFSGVARSCDYPENDHANSGLDLRREREFMLSVVNGATIAAAQPIYLFAVCQKKLKISREMVSVTNE